MPHAHTAPSKHGPKNKELLQLMFEMSRVLKREISRESTLMPSFQHAETLRFIHEGDAKGSLPTMSDVADYLKIAPPSATAIVNAFVKDGVIKRIADPSDRRIVRLSLSKKGIQFLETTRLQREKAFASLLAPLSAADSKELCRILAIITRSRE
jgi:DNA-binding MarR family transcriptional regulator